MSLRFLFSTLNNTVLTRCRWVSWRPIPSRIYQTLLTRQRSLKALELLYSEVPIDDVVGYGSSSLLRGSNNFERVRVTPGPQEPLPQVAHQFFQEPDNVRHLILELDHMAQDDSTNDKVNGRYTSSGALQALFGGLKLSTVRLRTLDLAGINLRRSHHSLVPALDIPSLETLVICKCQHTEDFLKAFCQARLKFSSMNLTSFEIYHAQLYQSEDPNTPTTEGSDPLLAAIDTFLATISPLRKLSICLRGFDRLPNIASVARHGPSLRRLFIDVRKAKGPFSITYLLQEWEILCMSLENIYQLDMTFPVARADCELWNHVMFCEYMVGLTDTPISDVFFNTRADIDTSSH